MFLWARIYLMKVIYGEAIFDMQKNVCDIARLQKQKVTMQQNWKKILHRIDSMAGSDDCGAIVVFAIL
jgi:hypothetical protein